LAYITIVGQDFIKSRDLLSNLSSKLSEMNTLYPGAIPSTFSPHVSFLAPFASLENLLGEFYEASIIPTSGSITFSAGERKPASDGP
jgi:hypothetical protein